MDAYTLLEMAHVFGATVLFGTGIGIAFFMVMAHRTGDPAIIAHTAGIVVAADWLFTASAVVLQPVTGVGLAHVAGYPLSEGWIAVSLALYLLVGACWLPVVWLQMAHARPGAPIGRLRRALAAAIWPLLPSVVRLGLAGLRGRHRNLPPDGGEAAD